MIVLQVVESIDRNLKNINFPVTEADIASTKKQFFKMAGIPNCLGAVDGTLIPIISPSGADEPVYICRKGFHALNVQAVADEKMR